MGDDPKTNHYRPADEITLSNATVWPWSTVKHLGIQGVPPTGTDIADYLDAYEDTILNETWREFRKPIVYDLLAKFERDKGLLRGHMVGEFRGSPQYWLEEYHCDLNDHDQILIETDANGGSGQNEPCRSGACTGVLHSTERYNYTCNKCGFHLDDVSITRKIGGSNCTAKCTGTMQQTSQTTAGWFSRNIGGNSVSTTYTCSVCGRTRTVSETAANAGTGANVACGEVCPRRGVMTEDPGSKQDRISAGPVTDGLSLPSWGGPLGGLFADVTVDPRSFWAHEIGHHKHMEHAADVISVPAQHDQATNSVDNAVTTDPKPKKRKWDRACIMGYVCQDDDPTKPDAGYFCGKCLLKLRGWKVQGLADPAGNLAGP
jgi:hypothetical protein